MTFPTEAESGVLQAAFGGDFCVTLKPNSGPNSATTVTSEEYTINEGVTTPFVVAGGAGSLTFEWSVNGGPWQSDGSYSWLQYMTDNPVPKPVTVQVGYGVSDSSLTLITDLRVV